MIIWSILVVLQEYLGSWSTCLRQVTGSSIKSQMIFYENNTRYFKTQMTVDMIFNNS